MSIILEGKEYLDTEEALKVARVNRTTLYQYIARGMLPNTRKHGMRRNLYLKDDLVKAFWGTGKKNAVGVGG